MFFPPLVAANQPILISPSTAAAEELIHDDEIVALDKSGPKAIVMQPT